MKKDIKLPHRKPKLTWRRLVKDARRLSKRAVKYFQTEPTRGRQSQQKLLIVGLIMAALALMLGLIPDLNSLGTWLAVMALAVGLLAYLNKLGGRTRQLLLLAGLALVVSVVSVLIQNSLRQSHINDLIDRREGRATEQLLRRDVEITVGEFSDEGLAITLKNKNSATKAYSIVVLARGGDGEKIIEQTISLGVLDPDETKQYQIFRAVSGTLAEKLRQATFEVTTVSQY